MTVRVNKNRTVSSSPSTVDGFRINKDDVTSELLVVIYDRPRYIEPCEGQMNADIIIIIIVRT